MVFTRFDLNGLLRPWPLTFKLQNISRSPVRLMNICSQFYRHCSSRSWDIVVTISEQTNEWTIKRTDGRTGEPKTLRLHRHWRAAKAYKAANSHFARHRGEKLNEITGIRGSDQITLSKFSNAKNATKSQCMQTVENYTVFPKKQPLWFRLITLTNVDRFSKFFHKQIPKEILYVTTMGSSISP